MVRDSSSSYRIDYVIVIKKSLNLEGHQNPISGSEVTAILLKGWFWPIGVVASGRVCVCSLRSRLVSLHNSFFTQFGKFFLFLFIKLVFGSVV